MTEHTEFSLKKQNAKRSFSNNSIDTDRKANGSFAVYFDW